MNKEFPAGRTVPDFICIGAPKAGTTWLYKQLAAHPGTWVPPVKELHYFDNRFPIPRVSEKKDNRRGFLGLFPVHSRRRIVATFGRAAIDLSLQNALWAIRYFGGTPSDEWYHSLFEPARRRVCGELTTDYCALSDQAVAHVHRLLPNAKILFLLRDPITRAWSHARMLLPELLGKQLGSVTESEFISYLRHPAAKQKSQYLRSLNTWERHYPSEQMFIGFYDELATDPGHLLKRVLDFLEVDSDVPFAAGTLHGKVNAGKGSTAVPEAIHRVLVDEYIAELQGLCRRFGGYTEQWLESARARGQ